MKILPNIIPGIQIYNELIHIHKYGVEIDKAAAAGDREREREQILAATSYWGNKVVKIGDVRLEVEGYENLPDEGPVVFVGNHQGYADIIVSLAVLDKFQVGFIAKRDLEKVPLYNKWLPRVRCIFIDRDATREALRAIEQGVEYINEGYSMFIYPEGKRSKGGPMQEFKKGSLRLATKPGVPVIPITIDGAYKIFEEQGKLRKGVTVKYCIHEPIPTAGMDKREASELAGVVEKIIRRKLAEYTGEPYTEAPAEPEKLNGPEAYDAPDKAEENENAGTVTADVPADTKGEE